MGSRGETITNPLEVPGSVKKWAGTGEIPRGPVIAIIERRKIPQTRIDRIVATLAKKRGSVIPGRKARAFGDNGESIAEGLKGAKGRVHGGIGHYVSRPLLVLTGMTGTAGL
jgi:hypothetical protein